MRRRAGGTIRIVDRCARCGHSLSYHGWRREVAMIGGRAHELAVCGACDRLLPHEPTFMEQSALGVDVADAVVCMEFVQRFTADAARVQRTAEYFLGAERTATVREESRRAIAAAAEQREERRARWWDRTDPSDDPEEEFS